MGHAKPTESKPPNAPITTTTKVDNPCSYQSFQDPTTNRIDVRCSSKDVKPIIGVDPAKYQQRYMCVTIQKIPGLGLPYIGVR